VVRAVSSRIFKTGDAEVPTYYTPRTLRPNATWVLNDGALSGFFYKGSSERSEKNTGIHSVFSRGSQ
jgi:hypothetical protein